MAAGLTATWRTIGPRCCDTPAILCAEAARHRQGILKPFTSTLARTIIQRVRGISFGMDMGKDAGLRSADGLLSDLWWIRSLARGLCNEQDVDDLVQEAWLVAVTHPPRDPGALRPWLRRVLGNLVAFGGRTAQRRARREAATARDAATVAAGAELAADELLARGQLEKTVGKLVLKLAEPFRTTVLLRYFDGLTAAEIARRQAVPAATVRWRLARARADLRAQLDALSGGNRRAWVALLLPLASGSSEAPPGTKPLGRGSGDVARGFLLGSPARWCAILVLALIAAGILWRRGNPPPSAVTPRPAVATGPIRLADTGELAARPPAGRRDPSGRLRTVAGRVLYEERPVEGALVELADGFTDTGAVARLTRSTDFAGRFDFGPQPAARWEIIASAPGRTPRVTPLELGDPRIEPDRLVLRLRDCGAPVAGVVRDVSGGPIAGARVCHAPVGQPRACAVSDDLGEYQLCVERDGSARLYAAASGYGAIMDRIYPHGARVRKDFALAPEGVIAGRLVRERDGEAVAGARVAAEPSHTLGVAPGVALSESDGRFALRGLAAGLYHVTAATASQSTRQPVDVRLTGGTRAQLTLHLADTSTVSGVVTADGQPVAGASLELISQVLSAAVSPRVITQRDGSFVLRGVMPGLNQPRLRTHDVLSPLVLDVDEPELKGVRIEVGAPAIVRGRVLRQGLPVPGAFVAMDGLETRSGETGAFELLSPRGGTHNLIATTNRARRTTKVQLRPGQITRIDLLLDAAAAISGVVVEPDGRPASGLVVVFSQLQGGDFSTCTSAEDGSFKVARLAGGDTYVARVQADLSSPAKLSPPAGLRFPEVRLPDGESEVKGVRLVVVRDHLVIAGVVVDADGQPQPDVEVSAVRLHAHGAGNFNQAARYPRATSAADGSFTIDELDRGPFLLHARAGDGPETELSGVRAGTRGVVLQLPPTGAIFGELVGFAEPPEVMATATGKSRRPLRATVTEGTFHLAHLVPGEYHLAALSSQAEAGRATVVAGRTTRVKIAARGRAMVRGRVVVFGRGDPVRGLVCKVLLDGASSDPRLPLPGGVVTDAQGRFELMAPAGVSALECRNGAGTTSSGAAVVTLAAQETRDVELAVVRPQAANPQWGKLTGALFEDSLIGAQVEAVVAGTPAQRAGLRAGDQVLAVDGAPVEGLTQNGILHLIYDRPVGATAGLTVARGADTLVVPVKVIAPAG